MRLKYYLRGLGIGVLVTTIILTIAGNKGNKISDEEIKRRAEKLGMVMKEEQTLFPEKNTEGSTEESTEATQPQYVTATITVTKGMYSEAVSQAMQSAGLIGNWVDFNNYLSANGYSERLQTGSYTMNSGMSYQEMAMVLVTR